MIHSLNMSEAFMLLLSEVDLRKMNQNQLQKQETSNLITQVSSLFFSYFSIDSISFDFYCQLRGYMNFWRHPDRLTPLNLEEAGDIIIVSYFLIFLSSLCSIELKMSQILAPARIPDFINSCPTLFCFCILFVFLFYSYLQIFS